MFNSYRVLHVFCICKQIIINQPPLSGTVVVLRDSSRRCCRGDCSSQWMSAWCRSSPGSRRALTWSSSVPTWSHHRQWTHAAALLAQSPPEQMCSVDFRWCTPIPQGLLPRQTASTAKSRTHCDESTPAGLGPSHSVQGALRRSAQCLPSTTLLPKHQHCQTCASHSTVSGERTSKRLLRQIFSIYPTATIAQKLSTACWQETAENTKYFKTSNSVVGHSYSLNCRSSLHLSNNITPVIISSHV